MGSALIAAAEKAQRTAVSRTTVYYSTEKPTSSSLKKNDLWVDEDLDIHQFDGEEFITVVRDGAAVHSDFQ